MLKKIVILLFFCFLLISFLGAQDKKKLKLGVETSPYISYSGVNWGIQINGFYKKHSLGIGTKVAFQSSYFPYQTSMGIIVDYKYFIVNNQNIKSQLSET